MSNTYTNLDALHELFNIRFQSGITEPRDRMIRAVLNAIFDQPEFEKLKETIPKDVEDSIIYLEETLDDWVTGVCYYSFITSITKLTLL